MTDEIIMTHSCGGKIVITDWTLEWEKDPDDTLVLHFFCERCDAKIEKRL